MQRRRLFTLLTVPALTAGLLLTATGPAGAAENPDTSSAAAAIAEAKRADAKGYLIVPAGKGVSKNGATFYPTGPISSDTLVVITEPDGSLPNGLTESKLGALASERKVAAQSGEAVTLSATTYAYSAASIYWSQAWTGGSKIGYNSSATVRYTFNAADNTAQTNAGQGLGYYRGYNGTTMGTWSAWYGVGSATAKTDATGTVPWGNVAAVAKFRAKCAKTTACMGRFW